MPSRNLPKPAKYSLKDFDREFPDDAACMRWLVEFLFPFGMHCLGCGEVRPHHQLHNRPKVWSCDYCGSQTHPTAGTIFHKSKTPLKTWFHAVYLMSATRCGISAMQLMRQTGVTYKTAWRMFTLIRKMLLEDVHDLGGDKIVEADETYFGPKVWRMNRRARSRFPANAGPEAGKVIIAGLAERGGRIVAYPVERRGFFELTQPIKERVKPGSEIHTDEAGQYVPLKRWGYDHKLVKHKDGVYVDSDGVSVNSIEGFWSHFKGSVRGTYKHISRTHLQGYLDEFCFRYNHREDGRPMFKILCRQISADFVQRHFPKKHRRRKIDV
jgi:transposase